MAIGRRDPCSPPESGFRTLRVGQTTPTYSSSPGNGLPETPYAVALRGWRVNCAGTRCGESAGLPLIRTPSSLAGSIGTAGKHFSLPLVLYTQLLNADGELLVI